MKVLTGEASKGYTNKNTDKEQSKVVYKYVQLNMFHNNCRLQVYMYAFMYVYPETISVADHFPSKKHLF